MRRQILWCWSRVNYENRVNVVGMLNLADVCSQRKLHLTTFATGCIYSYDKDHSIGKASSSCIVAAFTKLRRPAIHRGGCSKFQWVVLLKDESNG